MTGLGDTWRLPPRITDGLLFLLALVVGPWLALNRPDVLPPVPASLLSVDLAAGIVGCLALWWRRRYPVPVAAGLAVLLTFSEAATGAALIALFTVAIHRSTRTAVVLLAAHLAALAVYGVLRPSTGLPAWVLIALVVTVHVAVVIWGMLIRSRRELVASLRERAKVAEVEAALRAERTQHEARETLAREMHDALGHRLSLLSVHAGALVYYRDAPPEEAARAAEVIRENAHRALQDLREVIGVLRAPVGELPLPGAADVVELIDETGRTGTPVELADDHGVTRGARAVPDTVGRTLYRFIQESLTNARKHAPGSPVVVRITGEPGAELVTEVVNRGARTAPDAPVAGTGSGEGLRGLTERATLVGGRVEYGPTASGGWRVGMSLPWAG